MKKSKGIRRKILISYLLLVLFALSALGAGIYFPLENYFLENLEKDMINQAFITRTAISEEMSNSDFAKLQSKIERISLETNSRITVILRDGQVVADTEVKLEELENHRNRAEIIKAFQGETGVEKRYSNSTKRDMLYVAIPMYLDDQLTSVVRISYGFEFIESFLKTYRVIFFTGLFLSAIVAFLISVKVSKSLTEPIENINNELKEISQGNLEKVIYSNFENELGELAENINKMSSSLREKISEVGEEKNRLENIINTMTSGVIFLNKDARIIMVNGVAEKLLNISFALVKGKPIYEVLRNYNILNNIDKCINEDKIIEEDITLLKESEELYLKATFAPVYKEEKISGITVLLTDLTEEIKLSKLKTDFVTNASHELRTPLTSVKGYSETLLNGAMDDKELREKFIKIIDKEANRLILLVEDLMNLSRIEATKNTIPKEIIDLKKIIYSIYDSFSLAAEEKNIKIKLNLGESDNYFAYGGEDQIKQVIANFIDNAIKYTQQNGTVDIYIRENQGSYIVSVKDSGVGLSEEDSKRVFERFFRADRSRNKKNGGFGLGLSIAKNIIESFEGKIGVESELGKGSNFWFTLKKAD